MACGRGRGGVADSASAGGGMVVPVSARETAAEQVVWVLSQHGPETSFLNNSAETKKIIENKMKI